MKIILTKGIEIKGNLVKELDFDLNTITGHDLTEAEKMARIAGETNPMINFSMKYQAAIVAKLLGVKYDDVLDMSAGDFSKVTLAVANFLIT